MCGVCTASKAKREFQNPEVLFVLDLMRYQALPIYLLSSSPTDVNIQGSDKVRMPKRLYVSLQDFHMFFQFLDTVPRPGTSWWTNSGEPVGMV